MSAAENTPILVVGGGITGISAALELAEMDLPVILVEKTPFLGGRVAGVSKYFPKRCPPTCGLEINYKRLRSLDNVTLHTLTEVTEVTGNPGDYEVTLRISPRHVNGKCTACGDCAEACGSEREDTFNLGMSKTKAIYIDHPMAFPQHYVLDKEACAEGDLTKIKDACKYDAVELDQQEQTLKVKASAIIWATGWRPYDASKVDYLHYELPDVIANVEMERLCNPAGPTAGKILRPSDSKAPESVAFVQCSGSRDVNHLPYCSGICCLATLKQIGNVREQLPDAKIFMFHIDVRAGKYEDFFTEIKGLENVTITKGKVAGIFAEDGKLRLQVEDIEAGKPADVSVDLAVLATGIVPNTDDLPFDGQKDEFGFLTLDGNLPGIVSAGCVRRPGDVAQVVQEATGAAIRALVKE